MAAHMNLTAVSNLRFSEHGKIKFSALDKLRGDVEITFEDPRDVKVFMDFLCDMREVLTGERCAADLGFSKEA